MSSVDLSTPAGAARVLRAFGIRPRKRWGQHFLVSRRALDQILAAADLTDQDTVLEIGAGLGTLTAALAERAGRVIAVEIDRALLPALQAAVGSCPNVQTIIGDAMTIDLASVFGVSPGPRKLVANLPYNVASALIVALLEPPLGVQRMVVTVQREVAGRLSARPGTKDYGILSVAAQFRAEVAVVDTLPASAFIPPPEVESAVVRLETRERPVCPVLDEGVFFRVVRAAFSQRRKIVRNALAGGLPDPATFPVEEIKAITAGLLEREANLVLQYGPTEGDARLRDELVKWMAKDGIHVSRDQVLVTLGSQQGLDLVGRVFLDPGDLVIVELPSYMAALQVFRSYRAEMRGVPQDDAGMRADVLEETLARLARDGRRPKLIYVVPDFQNPSGVTMSNDRRLRLLQLARQYRTLVVEDNPYRELSFEGAPPPPLAALDREGRVIYLSTFSKTLCPGLRIAWIAASVEFIGRFVTAKQGMDLCCPALTQAIAAEFCAAGHLSSRVGAIVERYRRKRDTMLTALAREMPPGVTWTHPQGGLFLWVRLPDGMDTERLLPLAVEEGVAYVVGTGFHADGGGRNAMRLNFSFPSEPEIEEGVRRLARIVQRNLPSAVRAK